MHAVLETNDPVLLSIAQSVLRDAAIDCVVFDAHMAAMDGSIGAIPRRLCVPGTQRARAQALIDALRAEPFA